MEIALLFAGHWYASIFSQSFFNHRYAAHQQFTMNKFWEKFFYIFSFISMGSSYLSADVYAMLHRMHHAYTDTEKDPHSPKYDQTLFKMMWRTRRIYLDIFHHKLNIDEKFSKNIPRWISFENFANMRITRLVWILIYIATYIIINPAWYWYFLIPIHAIMGPLHGVIINWFGHKISYRNFETDDESKNIMPVDLILLGECYHNNHHKYPSRANFGVKWHEIDMLYPLMYIMNKFGIIKLVKT